MQHSLPKKVGCTHARLTEFSPENRRLKSGEPTVQETTNQRNHTPKQKEQASTEHSVW